MSKKASRRRWRAFGSAFMLTLCLLILGAGCLVAEYNTRRTAFGDARIQMDYRIQDGKVTIRTPSTETDYALPGWAEDWAGRAWTGLILTHQPHITGIQEHSSMQISDNAEAVFNSSFHTNITTWNNIKYDR